MRAGSSAGLRTHPRAHPAAVCRASPRVPHARPHPRRRPAPRHPRHEFGGEICVHYTSEPGSECKNEQLPWWRDCGFVRLSSRMLEYVKRFFFDDSIAKTNQRDTSAGFFGTVLALHLCGKVDIYGFTQRSGHYFEKLDRSKACGGALCVRAPRFRAPRERCLTRRPVALSRLLAAGEGGVRGEARLGARARVLDGVPGAAGRRQVHELSASGRREGARPCCCCRSARQQTRPAWAWQSHNTLLASALG